MKKRLVAALLSGIMVGSLALTGCSGGQADSGGKTQKTESDSADAGKKEADTDQKAADEVADMIDGIYVQTRTDETDGQCAKAKEAWDALTDDQKELVEGENADSDYFGKDTGDASKDDPRNQDDIGENEILVVSFGTSFNDSRAADIKGIDGATSFSDLK